MVSPAPGDDLDFFNPFSVLPNYDKQSIYGFMLTTTTVKSLTGDDGPLRNDNVKQPWVPDTNLRGRRNFKLAIQALFEGAALFGDFGGKLVSEGFEELFVVLLFLEPGVSVYGN